MSFKLLCCSHSPRSLLLTVIATIGLWRRESFCFVLSDPAMLVGGFELLCVNGVSTVRPTCVALAKGKRNCRPQWRTRLIPESCHKRRQLRPPPQWNISWENHREGSVSRPAAAGALVCVLHLLPLRANGPTSFRNS